MALYLKDAARLTLVDISAEMLAASRALNPECEHIQGDMLALRLGRTFDAVLVHDAADYVTTEAELALVAATAFAHCRPGGMAVFAPDHTADTFRPGRGGGGGSDETGRQASFRERTRDPDPADEWIESEYEFRLRSADGSVQVVRESHRLGAFRHEPRGCGSWRPPGSRPSRATLPGCTPGRRPMACGTCSSATGQRPGLSVPAANVAAGTSGAKGAD